MKTKVIGAILMVMTATGAWAQKGPQIEIPQTANCPDCPKISVSGEAVVHVKPDKVMVNLGIDTWDANIAVAKEKNAAILSRTVAAVQELGLEEDALQTDYLSIEPQWNYGPPDEERRIVGYFVRNRLVVTLSDVEKIEGLLTAALGAGVNQIHGLHLQSTALKQYREEVREEALRAAKEKAEKMAAVLGQGVGAPIHIHERNAMTWDTIGMAQIQLSDGAPIGGVEPSVVLGKLPIRAEVAVTFELLP